MMQLARSQTAQEAYSLVQELQTMLVSHLERLPSPANQIKPFCKVEWSRAQGTFGGGSRFMAIDDSVFNRASVNISQVQYEQDPSRKLASATALSTIIHPRLPFAPSMHMHISWTEMKSGEGYWRIMGDLNPSIPCEDDTKAFIGAFQKAIPEPLCTYAQEQGARYFYIPALKRHRGVAHFYLEEYKSPDASADFALAKRFGTTLIETYVGLVQKQLKKGIEVKERDNRLQLDYHTLYFLQVLTLDRGTTSGLLVHNENDVGILGSIPSHVDKSLLKSWASQLQTQQQILLLGLIECLEGEGVCLVDDASKLRLAEYSRKFYREHPEAQDLLAKGDRVPPTQQNHS